MKKITFLAIMMCCIIGLTQHTRAEVTTIILESEPLITNGDGSTDDVSCFFMTESSSEIKHATLQNGEFIVNAGQYPEGGNMWDSQFFVRANTPLQAGDKYKFSMKVKTTSPRQVSIQAHREPGDYHYWEMCSGNFVATEEWSTYEYIGIVTPEQAGDVGCRTIAFMLSYEAEDCIFHFKDIVWEKIIKETTDEGVIASFWGTSDSNNCGGDHTKRLHQRN